MIRPIGVLARIWGTCCASRVVFRVIHGRSVAGVGGAPPKHISGIKPNLLALMG